MNKTFLLTIIFFLSTHFLAAQLKFERGNKIYRENKVHFSGMATGIADLNGDLYDDLAVLNKSKFLEVGYNQGPNLPLLWLSPLKVYHSEEYSMVIADYDNDGTSEITTGGSYSGSKIFKLDNNAIIIKQQDIQPLIYTQASNIIDINNDGFLDYFACHDEGTNLILQNDKLGNLSPINPIDFSTIPPSDNSGSYGSEWSDIDNDGDMDLYLAKCKFGVTDREDPRRHNMMFINNGDGTFTNEAEARGLKIKGQSWTGSFADIDNDGDMDCIVTNHDEPHILLTNDGKGFFTPISVGLPKTFAFQSLWSDFDNDGFIDLLFTGADFTFIYKNKGGLSFERIDGLFGTSIINSAALGDINDDGFIDVNAIYGVNINYPGSIKDELFINQKNDNHYLKISLVGKTSNKMGIGARLTLYGPWGAQSREVQSGVSYGITNSLNQIFGLGQNTLADSLIVKWPSGIVDKYYNLQADQSYIVQEGNCITKRIVVSSPKNYICDNESIPLTVNANFAKYKWSNGSTDATAFINQPSAYFLIATDDKGCEYYSTIKYIQKPSNDIDLIQSTKDTIYFCNETTLSIKDNYTDVQWNNTLSNASITVSESQAVKVTAKDLCNNIQTDEIYVKKIPTDITIVNDTVSKGGNAILKAIGNNVKWYTDQDKNNLIHEGNELSLINIQNTTKYYVQNSNQDGVQSYTLGEKNIPAGTNVYSSDNNDIGLYLNVYSDMTIQSFEVASDKEGIRRFLLINYSGDTIGKKDVLIKASDRQLVEVNFKVSPGALYQLKTDDQINLQNLGHKAPRLRRLADNTTYPYEIYNVAEIPTSLRGGSAYYYFFNISIADEGVACESELQEVIAWLDTDVSTDDLVDNYTVHPNPTSGNLHIRSAAQARLSLYDEIGRVVHISEIQSGENSINLAHLQNGLYIMNIITDKNTKQIKVMIAH